MAQKHQGMKFLYGTTMKLSHGTDTLIFAIDKGYRFLIF